MDRIGDSDPVYNVGVDYSTIDLGFSYKFNDYFHGSIVNKNILHFAEKRYSDLENSTFEEDAAFSLPHYFNLGLAMEKAINIYLDNEFIVGNYGGKKLKRMDLWIMQLGAEKQINNFAFRLGITNPIIAKTSTLGDIRSKLPNPKFMVAAGCGFAYKRIKVDLAFFLNPGQSYVQRKPVPAIYLSTIFCY